MKGKDHDFIEVEEAEFLAWIRKFEDASGEELFVEEQLGTESGPHGE
jgi:hypothetical protein